MRPWAVEDLGRRAYAEVLALQHAYVAARQRDEIEDRLILVEHDDVVTLGRRRDAARNVLAPGAFPVVEIERGGDVTYHGPGQLVAYPIVRLDDEERDLHRYLRALEQAIILTCATLGVDCVRRDGYTGAWVQASEPRKVASIGIAVRRWVAFHGLALNVSTDLAKFAALHPCGLPASVMTSLTRELDRPVAIDEVKPVLAMHLGATLSRG